MDLRPEKTYITQNANNDCSDQHAHPLFFVNVQKVWKVIIKDFDQIVQKRRLAEIFVDCKCY